MLFSKLFKIYNLKKIIEPRTQLQSAFKVSAFDTKYAANENWLLTLSLPPPSHLITNVHVAECLV